LGGVGVRVPSSAEHGGIRVTERVRRSVFGVLFTLAVLGAAGLIASALVDGPGLRVTLQVYGTITAVVFGVVASVLAWRWWGGRSDR
jgi:uncharacterized YccA/Bax inhibitor family protein